MRLNYLCLLIVSMTCCPPYTLHAQQVTIAPVVRAFGENGKFKMLYDARHRPQSVLLHERVYIVYNGDAKPNEKGSGDARPMLITYDLKSRTFSESKKLGKRASDHHFSPVIWADSDDHLHVLYGCHRTPGTHLISTQPVDSATEYVQWETAPQIAPRISYPAIFRISDDRELIYYRTDGHTSSWSYRISEDNGQTWIGPEQDVIDLDAKGHLDWSSYQTKILSKDGKFLHVVYTDYDDNKHSPDPKRFYNPRYDQEVSNEWKYNLSYLKVDLQSHDVLNADGKFLQKPIDRDYSRENCQIWDTGWRGAGVPPAASLRGDGEPAFLHVLSGDTIKSHSYHYVRRVNGEWVKTPICHSNHQWNSGHLTHDADGTVHAYVIAGEGYLEGGYMDRHGGGRIEQWISSDEGDSWRKHRVISPTDDRFVHWRFNNVQPVVSADGSLVDRMLLFYGWKDANKPEAVAFLLHEKVVSSEPEQ